MSLIWQTAGVLAASTPSPSPTPGLREGLDESIISPGLAGFLAVFGIALVSVLLFYSLTSKLRGVRVRDGVAEPAVTGTMAGAGVVPADDAPQPAADPSPADDVPPAADDVLQPADDDAPPAHDVPPADDDAPPAAEPGTSPGPADR